MKMVSGMAAMGCLVVSMATLAQEGALVISHEDEAISWGPCPDFMPEGCEVAVLKGNPEEENVDIFFKVPGDVHIPYHKHTSQERMVLISGTLDVTYDDHETATMQAGDYAYGPAGLPHSAYCHEGEPCVLYIGFVAPLDAIPLSEK